jgi:lipopolysaccharide transport system ATP-binding protein
MGETVIRVENLSKQYRIGVREKYGCLRESLLKGITAPFQRLRRLGQKPPPDETIWALKDVSFEVKQAEILGVIGRNGAGKTTLLKVLSRITEPTEGEARIRGRVASLLEVGTGFHPELTGRENLFLNGAVLGMRRKEIERKFDEIVGFAEVERFIDTPVKRYSSGMYVRLAFAVAAHLEPEILLVDEVLAVGDFAFQKKCLGKMGKVAKEGRTVLFVSHNMAAVLSLCNEVCLLDNGQVVSNGPAERVVRKYLQGVSSAVATALEGRLDRKGDGRVRLTSISIRGLHDCAIRCGDRLRIRIGYTSNAQLSRLAFMLRVCDQLNRPVFLIDSTMMGGLPDELPASGYMTCVTAPINLVPDVYNVNAAAHVGGELADHVKKVCAFEVQADDFYGTGKLPTRQDALHLLKHEWRVGAGSGGCDEARCL